MTSTSPRPAPPPAAQRDAWLTVRVTREQAAVLALEAAREGVTVSEYVRRRLLAAASG